MARLPDARAPATLTLRYTLHSALRTDERMRKLSYIHGNREPMRWSPRSRNEIEPRRSSRRERVWEGGRLCGRHDVRPTKNQTEGILRSPSRSPVVLYRANWLYLRQSGNATELARPQRGPSENRGEGMYGSVYMYIHTYVLRWVYVMYICMCTCIYTSRFRLGSSRAAAASA